jgi:hypothetical protein
VGKFSKFMSTLNEAKTHHINIGGTEFEIEIMDSTHLKFRIRGSNNWSIPQHFAQIDDAMMAELKKHGIAGDRFFIA